jgi:1,4-alpha-glucan branching enzyme
MITKKKTQKSDAVKVSFRLPAETAEKSVAVVGDFNNWDKNKGRMRLDKKSGYWSKTITLDRGSEVQFRYLIDGDQWRNDEDADRYLVNDFGTENAVLVI